MANGATTTTTTAPVTAPPLLMRPIAWIPEARRRQLGIALLIIAALIFPFYIDSNDADVDSMANAAAYATLALGLNIVVGFAGLLDLGYAAFFAIGAYTLWRALPPTSCQPPWNSFWEMFHTLGLAAPVPGGDVGDGMVVHFTLSFWLALPLARRHHAAFFGVLFGFPTLPGCAATIWPSSPSGSARSIADRGAQLVGPDQWRRGAEPASPRRNCSAGASASIPCRIITLPSSWWRC